jgi:hypothetical protein
MRGKTMKNQHNPKTREELRYKMAAVFNEKMHVLSTEMQEILIDDLVTAFDNRLKVLNKAQSNIKFEIAESVDCETLQT